MYPISLLPKNNYVSNINIDCLLNQSDLYLIRRVDDVIEHIYDEDLDYIKVGAFYSNDDRKIIELPGMSMNLLCFNCGVDSTLYRSIGLGNNSWDGETIIPQNEITNYFEEVGTHVNIYLPINAFHNHEFDIVYPKQGDTHKQLKKMGKTEFKDSTNDQGQDIVIVPRGGKLFINHVPTMLNYWHFELECNINGKVITRKPNTTQKGSLKLLIEQFFSMTATVIVPDPNNLDPQECYLSDFF